VHFHFASQKVHRYFNDNYIIKDNPKKNRSRRNHRNQKNQTPKDGWADYEGEVSRYEDRYPKEEISPKGEADAPIESVPVTVEKKEQAPPLRSTPPIKQVWKVKVKSVLETIPEEEQPVALFEPSEVPWDV
jgi:hypothetical protein